MIEKIPHQLVSTSRVNAMQDQPTRELVDQSYKQDFNQNENESFHFKNKEVEDIIQALNDFLNPSYTSIKFEFHEKLGEYYVQVIDDDTKEVIREVPPKKMLDLYAAMAEQMGLLFDKKI